MHYYKTALYTTIKNFPFPVGRLGATQQFTTPICVPKYNEDMAQSYLCEGMSETLSPSPISISGSEEAIDPT